ncbi:hypothetical protein IRJ41_018919, partial [Triplophysa rosa]
MQTVLASEGQLPRLCVCGNKISGKDTYQVCSACLGLEHCACFTLKSLCRRLARQASLSGEDPLMSASPASAVTLQVSIPVELPTKVTLSWEWLNIPWPTVVVETAKSRYEGKRLPRAKWAARQLLLIFPELLEEVAVTWKDKPLTEKVPIQGGTVLDLEGMEKDDLLRMPPMEPLVASL